MRLFAISDNSLAQRFLTRRGAYFLGRTKKVANTPNNN